MRWLAWLETLAVAALVLGVALTALPLKIPAQLFPEAVEVRVYGGDFFRGFVGPAKDGGVLKPEEVSLLRRSVSFGPRPRSIAMCCNPRHAFVFYGTGHKRLGILLVCFECNCASIEPPENSHLKHLNWDQTALEQIVDAHGLPVQHRL